MIRCEARGTKLAKGKNPREKAKCYTVSANQHLGSALANARYQVTKYVFNMQAKFDAFPRRSNCRRVFRSAIPGQDDRKIYEVIQSAFEKPGRISQLFEDWKGFMLRPDIFKSDLWFLAMKDEKMVGACLCYEYYGTQMRWVRQMGVLESERRTGLGSALLRTAFVEFYKRGFKKVGLGVEASNLQAVSFYENVGMKQIRRFDEYTRAFEEWT
jgi:ribosomal protein S18 acetylase RimI-like enzyme